MINDPLYFPRQKLADIIIQSLKEGISNAFTLFAPRRMGKTQFLIKDIAPLAEQTGFNVFYFSFMEADGAAFHRALNRFAQSLQNAKKATNLINDISKIEILGVGIERQHTIPTPTMQDEPPLFSHIVGQIAQNKRPTLLLLDEIQELAKQTGAGNSGMIRSLRTGLDIHQNQVKTIFTGSSTNGLRAMFNDNKAPFFHFAHALDFPKLGSEFTDFLADIYQRRTGRESDKAALYHAFEDFQHTPLYMRAMIQDMIINPDLSIEEAKCARLKEMHAGSDTARQWQQLSRIEQLIMQRIAQGQTALYTTQSRQAIAQAVGLENISTSTIQSNLKKLERKDLITRDSGNTLQINSPIVKNWITDNTD